MTKNTKRAAKAILKNINAASALVKIAPRKSQEPKSRRRASEEILICDGQVVVESQGRTITHLHGGSLVGELALVSGRPASRKA